VKQRTAIFPGTFDPVTLGHIFILMRTLHIFDRVLIAVAASDRQRKQPVFTLEERIEMVTCSIPRSLRRRIEIEPFEGLLVEFARARGVRSLIRGLRFFSDFEYEFQMATMNQKLWPEIDTLFVMPTEEFSYINSTLVKEIARHGGDLSKLVAPSVARMLSARMRQGDGAKPRGSGRRSR